MRTEFTKGYLLWIHDFFYKNTLYKNVHDENGQKILPSWKFSIFMNIFSNASKTFSSWFSWPILFYPPFSFTFTLLFDDFETMTGKI